jgi:hypothetical protein
MYVYSLDAYIFTNAGRRHQTTGYAGQELVGLSPATPGDFAGGNVVRERTRHAPAAHLTKVWDGQVEPHGTARIGQQVEMVFSRCLEARPRLGQSLVDRIRVIDLSGAFRIRTTARARLGIRRSRCRPVGVWPGGTLPADVKAPLVACPGCSDPRVAFRYR